MCGIIGLSGGDLQKLPSALSLLSHRGPDDAGLFIDELAGVGLGHHRLSIIDLSSQGHQPMKSEDDRVVLVFNGEIYNYRELREELESQGQLFVGHSDTEVLLNMYLKQRTTNAGVSAMLQRLNGIFAFAIWDADFDAMLLARDALGVKPLYYSNNSGVLAFASELKALQPLFARNTGNSSTIFDHLDHAAIDRNLSFLWCPAEGTPSYAVRKLGPGEALWVKQGAITEKLTWYKLPAFRINSSRRIVADLTEKEAILGTEWHLRQAVNRQMIADVPVGAFLSGGLDSSSIVALAREMNPDIRCFTIEATGDDDAVAIDLPYARRVAAHLKVPLEVVRIDAAKMAEDLPAMVAQMDEPIADPATLNVLYISRLAREHGIKALLSGAGGDDLFTGYRRHRALMAESYWSWLPQSARSVLEQWTNSLDQNKLLFRRMRKLFNGAALEGDARIVNYFRWIDRKDLAELYTPAFREALGTAKAEDPMMAFLAELPPHTSKLERMLALEQRFFLTDHNLLYTDKMSMAAGVEVRVPFLDLDLVEFAARIPARFKQRGSQGKWVLKKAMEPYLPKNVIYRPKSGFGAPLRHWMRVELRDLLAEVLGTQSLQRRGLFEPIAVQKLISANDQGKIDASYTLLALMCVELWCRRFMDQTVASVGPDFKENVL